MYLNQYFGVLFITERPLRTVLVICSQGREKTMENSNSSKGMHVREILAVWGSAFFGSIVGSVIIAILGTIYVITSNPGANVEFERGAALVGAAFGSVCSIPIGLLAGGTAGVLIFNRSVNRNPERPTFSASALAFVIGAIISGVILVPLGFIFFGLGHI